jgi:hypothetical protein
MKAIQGFARATRGLRAEIGGLKESVKAATETLKSMEEEHETERAQADFDVQQAFERASREKKLFRVESLQHSDLAVRRFTYAPSWAEFVSLVTELRQYASGNTGSGTLDFQNMVAIALIRLRHALTLEFLAVMFFGNISLYSNVDRIIHDMWILIDASLFAKTIRLLSAAEIRQTCTPADFAEALANAVLVLDCTYQYLQAAWGQGAEKFFVFVLLMLARICSTESMDLLSLQGSEFDQVLDWLRTQWPDSVYLGPNPWIC